MIVTDLDRTLLHSDKKVSAYTVDILKKCQRKGLKIAFATARPVRATKKFQTDFTADYIIADNGATITCGEDIIYSQFIPSLVKDDLIKIFIQSKNVKHITVETGQLVYTDYDGPPWEEGWNIVYNDFFSGIREESPKLSVESDDIEYLKSIITKYPKLHLYSNSGESWHQIMCRESTKMNAINYIIRLLGYSLDDITVFGDDYNDIEMLSNLSNSIAVANAIDEAKTAARYICDSNDNDGVAKWIEENLLQNN